MKDNRGITLIELITVMVIMAIVSIGTSVSINLIGYGSSLSTVKRIAAGLEYVQLQNMSKAKNYYLVVEKTDNTYYLSVEEEQDDLSRVVKSKEKLKLNNGTITFQNNDGSDTIYAVGNTAEDGSLIKLEVKFRKDTGGVGQNSKGKVIKTITAEAAGRSDTIRLVQMTGKVVMK